jgi:hypothetical protein
MYGVTGVMAFESAFGRGGRLIDVLRWRAALLGSHSGSQSSPFEEESYNDCKIDADDE